LSYPRLATSFLERIFRGETVAGLSEWQLLERYLERRDEVAFEALVARHGPMVLGVCRRMLTDQTDVEDAFQAMFLVLVRRARHLGPRDAIGPWLYGVAARVALRARSEAARRRRVESISHEVAAVSDQTAAADREIGEVIDQELYRLPSKYRSPIVLCYLEGQTHEEAARQLKWPIGTVKGRLARARDLLRSRLVRRGMTPSSLALTSALSRDSTAAVHRELLDRTVKASLKLALGQATAQVVSSSIASLVEGVVTSMFLNTFKWTGPALIASGLALTGAVVIAQQEIKQETGNPSQVAKAGHEDAVKNRPAVGEISVEARAADPAKSQDKAPELTDLQKELLRAVQMEWEHAYREYLRDNTGLERAYQASKRLMDAQQAKASSPDAKVTAVKAHFDRVRDIARTQHANPSSTDLQSAQVKAYAAEAELGLAQAKASPSDDVKGTNTGEATREGRGKDPKSQQILAKLEEPISMSFNLETPLEDVLKYIRQATTTKTYAGIPIYVDPVGLQEAERSLTSTVKNIDLEGVPLRRTLQLLLKQLDLVYFVDDGILCITSAESEGAFFGPSMYEVSPILQQAARAERGELSLAEMKELIELFKTRNQVMRLASGEREPKHDAAEAKQTSDETKQHREQMDLLLKEMRELIEILKAEKQTKKTAAAQ